MVWPANLWLNKNLPSYSVIDYDVSRGVLLLHHAYTPGETPVPLVEVDVQLVLESITRHDLQQGAWLNVVGYVRRSEEQQKSKKAPDAHASNMAQGLRIQAILLWDAGAVLIREYEKVLCHRKKASEAVSDKLAQQA